MTDLPDNSAEFLKELETILTDPIHKRIIHAYSTNEPLQTMEAELARVVQEIVNRED